MNQCGVGGAPWSVNTEADWDTITQMGGDEPRRGGRGLLVTARNCLGTIPWLHQQQRDVIL